MTYPVPRRAARRIHLPFGGTRVRRAITTFFGTAGAIGLFLVGMGFMIPASADGSATYSIWPAITRPSVAADPDTKPVELGLEFSSATAGVVTAVKFYRSAQNLGPHTGRLWSSSGRELAKVSFPTATTVGWQLAKFSRPVLISPNQRYIASYTAPHGRYSADTNVFSSRQTVKSGKLTAWRGVYNYSLGWPRDTWEGANYYVDIVFSEGPSGSATAATSVSPSPALSSAPSTTPVTPTTAAPAPTKTTVPPASSPGSTSTPTGTETFTPGTGGSSGASYATASTTGVDLSVPLQSYVGEYRVTKAGSVVENLDIRGSLTISASDVIVRNVRVTCSNSWWVIRADVPRVTIQDSTLTVDRTKSSNYCQYGITAGDSAKIHRNEISYTPDGLTFAGNSAEVVGNWVHNQIAYPGKEDHVDAAQLNGGGTGPYVFRNNYFSVPESQTGCLALFADFGVIRNVLADGNVFDGAGYSVYGGTTSATNVRFTNNWFARTFYKSGGYWGPVTRFHSGGKVTFGRITMA